VTITVVATNPSPGNHPPRISITPSSQTVQYSDPIAAMTIAGTDRETPGSGLSFGASGMPRGVSLTDNGNGSASLHGIADDAPGLYTISVTVRDGSGAQASATASVTITQEDVAVRYTGDHLVFTEHGASSAEVRLQAILTDGSAGGTATPSASVATSPGGDSTPGDVSNSTVTFMKGDGILCGPVPVELLDASDRTIGTAACPDPVELPVGSHNIDVHVEGSYSFSGRVGQVEIDKATRSYLSGCGFVVLRHSAGELAGDGGSRASFGFRVLDSPGRTNVRGHMNLLFVSGGSTYQVRSRDIDRIVTGPGEGIVRFVTHAALADATDPLEPVFLGSHLRVVVQVSDHGPSGDRIAIAVYRGSTLVFASRWNGGPLQATLGGGGIVVH